MKLSELLEDYRQQTRTQIEESTADSAAYRMNDLISAVGDICAHEVTYRHCERFQQYCIDRGPSPASANTHIKMVRRIFALAVKRGQLERNPFAGISLVKVPEKSIRLLSRDEFNRILLAAACPLWKARILLAKTAALRRGEVLNLTLRDVDFANTRVVVQPKEDTASTWRWVVKDKERRELPLVGHAEQMLARLQTELPA